MLGYSTLLCILLGGRRVLALWPWLVLGAVFWVFSLGEELSVAGRSTGIPLPYRLFRELPVLALLRKSDRCFLVVQLASSVALGAALAGLAERLRTQRSRGVLCATLCALVPLELTGAPFGRFRLPLSPGLQELREDRSSVAIMELPVMEVPVKNARYMYAQTVHEKKSTLGYTTSTSLLPLHEQRQLTLTNLYLDFINGRSDYLPRLAAKLGVDRVVHYKSFCDTRPKDPSIDGVTLWKPFFFERRALVRVRQMGEYVERPYPPEVWQHLRQLFTSTLGPALFEDELLAVFPVPRS